MSAHQQISRFRGGLRGFRVRAGEKGGESRERLVKFNILVFILQINLHVTN